MILSWILLSKEKFYQSINAINDQFLTISPGTFRVALSDRNKLLSLLGINSI
jgi:hypothetical protein